MSYVTPFRREITLVKALLDEVRAPVDWSRLKGSVDLVQGSEEWHKHRESTIGSSEAAAVFPGVSTTCKHSELFAKLIGAPVEKKFDDYILNAMAAGKQMEPVLRSEMSKLLGRSIYEAGIFHAYNKELDFTLSASPDGLITDDDGLVSLLEIKWRMKSSDWEGDLGNTVFCQVQHQMHVLDVKSAYVYCGCDGERSLWLVRWAPDYFEMWLGWAMNLLTQARGAMAIGSKKAEVRTAAGSNRQIESFLHRYKHEHVQRVVLFGKTPQQPM